MSIEPTALPGASRPDTPSPVPAAGFFCVGASHHTAPLALRERLALTAGKLDALHARLAALPGLREIAILNTCNRVEFYGVADPQSAIRDPHFTDVVARLESEFCALQQVPPESFRNIRRRVHGLDALRHLLDVSAGLDSQMLGETEILGQVKEAYAAAQTRRTAGPVLNRVFQKTFQHAKYIRTHTAVTEGVISTANVAVDLAQKIFGRLDRTRILFLGAGEIAGKTARAFQSRGAAALTVASRTFERALELARLFNGAALPFENVPRHLADYDIVVCSTAAPGAVITREAAAGAMRARRARPLFFIDLALPRDVDPSVADLENVFIYNLDDLARIADENLAARASEVAKARELARQKAAQLWDRISCSDRAAAPDARTTAPAPPPLSAPSSITARPRSKAAAN